MKNISSKLEIVLNNNWSVLSKTNSIVFIFIEVERTNKYPLCKCSFFFIIFISIIICGSPKMWTHVLSKIH